MKKLLKKFVKNKSFIAWSLSILFILFFLFNPILSIKKQYMMFNNINDFCYIYYVFLLPMSFYDMSFIDCLFLELIYFSFIIYISVSYVNLFFRDTSSVTLTRLNREKWIKEIIGINSYHFNSFLQLSHLLLPVITFSFKGNLVPITK